MLQEVQHVAVYVKHNTLIIKSATETNIFSVVKEELKHLITANQTSTYIDIEMRIRSKL